MVGEEGLTGAVVSELVVVGDKGEGGLDGAVVSELVVVGDKGEEGLDGAVVSELVVVGDKEGGCWVCWGVGECEEGWEDVKVGG